MTFGDTAAKRSWYVRTAKTWHKDTLFLLYKKDLTADLLTIYHLSLFITIYHYPPRDKNDKNDKNVKFDKNDKKNRQNT